MAIGPIVNLAGGYIHSLVMGAVHGLSGHASSTKTTGASGASASSVAQDTNQLSPFAQLLGILQQLQQSSPAQYQQVTQQISSNLRTGAQSATAAGNTSLASQLTQLSADFHNASASGQVPNVQDLAQAIGGGHHHGHHSGSSSATPPSAATNSSTTNAGGNLSQLLQSLNLSQAGTSANPSLSALSIIDNTLSGAGIQIG